MKGLEPPRLAAIDPKSTASASSATSARYKSYYTYFLLAFQPDKLTSFQAPLILIMPLLQVHSAVCQIYQFLSGLSFIRIIGRPDRNMIKVS